MNDENEVQTEETPIPDPRIIAALEDLDYPHEINPHTADFHVRYNLEDGREQMVTICSATDEFMGIELRDICSTALVSDGIFDARTANFLLRENAELKFGNWCIRLGVENKHYAVFCMRISAALPHRALAEIMDTVAQIADRAEERLSGLDEF